MKKDLDNPTSVAPAGLARRNRRRRSGVVLMEVVIAMAIFFAAAAVITGGITACIRATSDARLAGRASDLAVTLLSEVQMGLLPVADAGPSEYEDPSLEGWTWRIITSPLLDTAGGSLMQVEIVIANESQGYTYRLVQLMPDPAAELYEEEFLSSAAPADRGRQ